MWTKIKDVIFHRVLMRSLAAAAATSIAWVSKPDVVAKLADWGVLINPEKLSASAMVAGTFILTLAYHLAEHKLGDSSVKNTNQTIGGSKAPDSIIAG